jgi:hypothetical protein
MIYIDPPYNTGNDFMYPDDYAESLQRRSPQEKRRRRKNKENELSHVRHVVMLTRVPRSEYEVV